jgi:hypothetical protein
MYQKVNRWMSIIFLTLKIVNYIVDHKVRTLYKKIFMTFSVDNQYSNEIRCFITRKVRLFFISTKVEIFYKYDRISWHTKNKNAKIIIRKIIYKQK